VNIASRIHGLAGPNGIAISEKVYSDIANKEGLEIEFLGEQALKGVSKPVGIYKVSYHDESLLDFTIDTGELTRPLGFGRTTMVLGIIVIALLAFTLYYFLPKIIKSYHRTWKVRSRPSLFKLYRYGYTGLFYGWNA
jgi:hypothetical protein